MSRIGKQPIVVPSGVSVEVDGQSVTVKGPKGEAAYVAPGCIAVAKEGGRVVVSRTDGSRHSAAMFGTVRNLVNNIVIGVSRGYRKELLISGVGYKAVMKGGAVVLSLGYSHEIEYAVPDGVKVEIQGGTTVVVEGIDKQLVGEVSARIRGFAPAEPYKGKGVRYSNEQIRRKEGKAVA